MIELQKTSSQFVHRTMKRPLGYLLAVLFVMPTAAFGMDFTWRSIGRIDNKKILVMRGEIRRGDSEKLRESVLSHLSEYFGHVELSSNGGDLVEAIKISKILRAMYADISVAGSCASSCFVLYMSGIQRSSGSIGIHRAYFDRSYFSGLSLIDAEKKHAQLQQLVAAAMKELSVPQSIVEIMDRTASSEIYWLSKSEMALLGERPAWYEELLIAKCPDFVAADKRLEGVKLEDPRWAGYFMKRWDAADCMIDLANSERGNLRAFLESTKPRLGKTMPKRRPKTKDLK